MGSENPETLSDDYTRVFHKDSETGGYCGAILEFEGCLTQGGTLEETWKMLDDAALSWMEACREMGQEIPKPKKSLWRQG